MTDNCPCGSNKTFEACCGRFLCTGKQASTPEQLMRSRYSAYALGGHGDYLLRTWFPATARGLTAQTLSRRDCEWTRLEVLAKQQRGDKGMVEFRAHYRDAGGREQVMHEVSVFQRLAGRWLYVGGEVDSSPA
ncbi:MAG: YchJ family metal-binding protein [Halieaceae bacterium]|jgi:SEC-C motif-containing protein|nr:YchJ family metal-binding protein [Halieaceae bacterium]